MSQNLPTNENGLIVLINCNDDEIATLKAGDFKGKSLLFFSNEEEMMMDWESSKYHISAIISKSEILGNSSLHILETLNNKYLSGIPIFLLVTQFNKDLLHVAIEAGIMDVFEAPIQIQNIEKRVNFVVDNWNELQRKLQKKEFVSYRTPIGKRIFDVLFSGFALLAFSPIFLVVYLIIKLESPGPAFYYSFRVGTGYRIFKFYKFRSMFIDAEQRLKDLKHLNQYNDNTVTESAAPAKTKNLCKDCIAHNACQFPLFTDNSTWCEKEYISVRKSATGSAFIKIKNDPRVTKIGNVIRNLSIDELPQLWNVFIGDMSIVGNRPLPLYEAEKLIIDKYALRFNAPAGITGLWQVEKRGKDAMDEEERLMLDNSYALNHSFRNDLSLIFKTIPALLQKESV